MMVITSSKFVSGNTVVTINNICELVNFVPGGHQRQGDTLDGCVPPAVVVDTFQAVDVVYIVLIRT